MAVLNKIRQRSLFLILIIALALFSFVLADLFRNGDALTSKSQNVVATINGKDITREAFMQKVELAQRQSGPNATSTQAMNRVWEQELRNAIMQTQYDELGISVEKDQMRDLLKTALATNPEFSNEDGVFDENKLNEYIANIKETSPARFESWVNYEKQVAAGALNKSYFNMVKAGLNGTLHEGELDHKLQGNKVDIKYVQVPYTSIPDSTVQVSKAEISDFIKKHKNEYQVEASRDIRFVEFKEVASLEDENNIKAELQTYVNGRFLDERGRKDTIVAFSKVKNNEAYVNSIAASDLKFIDRFVFKADLPVAAADSIFNLSIADVYGPYKDDGYYKVSKVVAVKQIPDSAKVRHILIPFKGSQGATEDVTKTESEAKSQADSLLSILKTNRSKFPEFVKDFSSDQGSVSNEGRYDWHAYNSMVPEFNTFEFEGKTGDLGVVKTIFGFHIIEIEGQKDKSKAMQVATIARKIEPSEKTIDKVFRDASNFEIKVTKGDYEAIAKESNYVVKPVNGIKVLDEAIPGIGNQRPIVRWSFETETKVGAIKRFNIKDGYVIAQLVKQHEEGLMSVEDATAKVMPLIRKEKKAKMIKDRISVNTLEDLASAESVSQKTATGVTMKNPTISGAGREPFVVGAAFGLQEEETSSLLEGEKGVYLVKVTKITPAVKLDNYQSNANRLEKQNTNGVEAKLYNALKEVSEIEDNRAELVQ